VRRGANFSILNRNPPPPVQNAAQAWRWSVLRPPISKMDMNCRQFISSLHQEESGQDLLEYALVLATILTAVVAGSNAIASVISSALSSMGSRITSVVQ
jgi:Flp pilus assembly pilin Flp